MRIKKIIRALLITFLILFILIIGIANSRYIWKLFGYTFCEEIDNIQIYSVSKEYSKGSLVVKGEANNSAGYYSGYTFNIRDDKLYIGLKYNKYYGYNAKTKYFEIEIPCKLNEIKSIYLIDGNGETKIQ